MTMFVERVARAETDDTEQRVMKSVRKRHNYRLLSG